MSVLRTAACFLCGGAIMGLLRGSVPTGVLSGAILLGLCLLVALPIIALDYLSRPQRRAPAAADVLIEEREAA